QLRQIGAMLHMYGNDHRGQLPPWDRKANGDLWEPEKTKVVGKWIHLGLLYSRGYSGKNIKVFVCPKQIDSPLVTQGFGERDTDQYGIAGYWYWAGANDYRRDNL